MLPGYLFHNLRIMGGCTTVSTAKQLNNTDFTKYVTESLAKIYCSWNKDFIIPHRMRKHSQVSININLKLLPGFSSITLKICHHLRVYEDA